MIKHIVCFMLKDKSEDNCRKAQEVLLSMKGNVELLRDIRVGVDFLHSDRSCDVVLEIVVDDRAALEAYQNTCMPCARAAFRRIMNFNEKCGRGRVSCVRILFWDWKRG